MARGQVQSCTACKVDSAARLEPRLLNSVVAWKRRAVFAPNSFAIHERKSYEPEEVSCNHSDLCRVRVGRFRLGPEFNIGQKGRGQYLGLKRPLSSESRRVRGSFTQG